MWKCNGAATAFVVQTVLVTFKYVQTVLGTILASGGAKITAGLIANK